MGTTLCEAVGADPSLELVAVVDPAHAGEKLGPSGLVAAAGPEAMAEADVEVAVDFTVAAAARANALWCADNGVHSVIGTTGFSPGVLAEIRARFEAGVANCVVAPNFAIGAVLMMRFAELAAPFFETVEIIELHHDGKVDAPSGTAVLTAQRISEALKDQTGATVTAGGAGCAGTFGAPARSGRPPGSPFRHYRPDADNTPRLDGPELFHARRSPRCEAGAAAAGLDRRARRLARLLTLPGLVVA
jgi:4-hydroxy-tetrahydrodipicolinate reductase